MRFLLEIFTLSLIWENEDVSSQKNYIFDEN